MILLLGLVVLTGTIGAKIFQRFRIPQVVGYIVIGVLIGGSVLNIVNDETVTKLAPFNMFALGLIGFTIGGELKYEIFKKYGKQFIAILFSEALTAFVVTTVLVTVVSYFLLHELKSALALGLVLGAISSATAPAATVDVLWEYKTRGPLTRTVLAIVALDDGLALILFGLAGTAAELLKGSMHADLASTILLPAWDIGGAVVIGVVMGLVLVFILNYVHEPDKILTFSLASVLLIIGLSIALEVDSILAAMALGATISNRLPRRSHSTFELVEKFTPPIYVLFFVLVGARLHLDRMPVWVVIIAFVYVLARTGGKLFGAWFGGRIGRAENTVQKYLGLCLFSQAGVAVGLSIVAGQRFDGELGQAIVLVITATTFLVQLIGPGCVKYAVTKAGEVGMNVTEEDLIKTYSVGEVMDAEPAVIKVGQTLNEILGIFSRTEANFYPVVDNSGSLMGVVTLKGIKETFAHEGFGEWLLGYDLMEPVFDKTWTDQNLEQVVEKMEEYDQQYMPVVESQQSEKLKGVIELPAVKRKISAQVLERKRMAE